MKLRLMRVFSRTARDRARELDEEIEAHLALRAADLEAQGMSPAEARAEALARFGDLEAARRDLYSASPRRDLSLGWHERLDDIRRDFTVALRRARTRPGHTLVSTAIFALGIGVATLMFAITDNVLFRPLPFPEPDRLVSLQSVGEDGTPILPVSMGNWYDWREQSRSLERTAVYHELALDLSTGADVFRAQTAFVSGSFFEILSVPMIQGRYFLEGEVQDEAPLVVISEGFWRRALGAAPDLSGEALTVGGQEYRVVGVVPASFGIPSQTDLWIPYRARPESGMARNAINWLSIARLAEGVSIDQAQAELSSLSDGIRELDPEALYSYGVAVEPLHKVVVGDAARNLMMLQGAVLLVLLVACVNLMGLEFAGASQRQEEFAVRLSLGVTRGRLFQQLVTEQLAVALLGGVLGLILASWGTMLVMGRLGAALPRAEEVIFDARIVAIGFVLSLLAGLLAGLGPALRVLRGNPGSVLAGTRTIRGGRGLPGGVLVSAEVALTVILLIGGGLLLRSMDILTERDLGFDPEGVVTLDVNLLSSAYLQDQDRIATYWDNLMAALKETPGVEGVGAGNWIPTGGKATSGVAFDDGPWNGGGAGYQVVNDSYFEAMGTPLLQGRGFGPDDQMGSQRVVIVNEAMVRVFWPGEDPLGKEVKAEGMENFLFGGEAPWLSVVGVVGDVRHSGFEDDVRPEMFTLYRQIPRLASTLVAFVRARPGSMNSVMAAATERARAVDPALAVEVGRLDQRISGLIAERRIITAVLVAFGITALGLASLGVYGLLAFSVSTRKREMSIRSALGAERTALVGLVVRSGLRVVALGLLAGAVGAFALRRVLGALLVDVSPGDPLTAMVVISTIAVASLAAALTPALRAARMDPLEALR